MRISVKDNIKAVLKDYKRLQKDIKDKAILRALNKAGDRADVEVRRRIKDESGLKAGYIARKTNKSRATRNKLVVTLRATKRNATNLVEWVTKTEQNKFLQRRTASGRRRAIAQGVTASAWKKKKLYKGTFIVKGRFSGKPVVVSRSGRGRTGWSKTVYGPIVWREFTRYSEEEAQKAVDKYFAPEFRRQVAFLLAKSR